ncbi:MAG: helix-turn-helix domain-containing protein [Bacilli bacterium]
MIKYYYFYSYNKFDRYQFETTLRSSFSSYLDIDYIDDKKGIILSDEFFAARLHTIFNILSSDLSGRFVFLETFENECISNKALSLLIDENKIGVFYLADLLVKNNNMELFELLDILFSSLDIELINTADAYLECSLSGVEAATELYIHRNTFNYRLNKFIEKTGLDIRDYKYSLIYYLYRFLKKHN